MTYISDVVHSGDLRSDEFNLIAAGCGTGKTYWVINNLMASFPNIKPYEVAFVTSRSITKEQQARNRSTTMYHMGGDKVLQFWNDKEKNNEDLLLDYGIILMTYDQMIDAIASSATKGSEVLQNVKIIVFDECHVMFCDTFIKNMNLLLLWTREVVYGVRKLFIGLSATPNIIECAELSWGVPINKLNKVTIVSFQAKQLICTNYETIPYLISSSKLPGKTMIMCHSYKLCKELASHLSNASIMVSKNSKDFTPEMKRIRDYIINNEELPPTFFDKNGSERDLDVLISTSTLREGFSLKESSGVRNMVTCMTDEIHITQFAGRCRYNIDNLVVAETLIREDNAKGGEYLAQSRKQFKDYMQNKECITWFAQIQHIVEHDVYHIKKFVLGTDVNRFVNYMNSKWLIPIGADSKLQQKFKVWRVQDKKEIVEAAITCRLFSIPNSRVSFNAVMNLLQNQLGYGVDTGQSLFNGKRRTYKLIVSYNAETSIYVPPFEMFLEDEQ